MSKKEVKYIKGFTRLSSQDYYEFFKNRDKCVIDEIFFGNYADNGCGCAYEAHIQWYELKDEIVPRLSMFAGTPLLLTEHGEFITKLMSANSKDLDSSSVARLLIELGYKDFSDNPQK